MARHEFRFVVDGVDLSEDAQERIASAVAEAGALEVSRLGSAGGTGERQHGNPTASYFSINPEWYGRWLIQMEQAQAQELAAKLAGSVKEH